MDLVELSRRLENIIRLGTIHSVDHAAVRVRVQTGNLITQWLPWLEERAGQTTTWNPPTIGEQCILFSPSGEPENAIALMGLNSDAIQPPSHSPDDHVTLWPDGTRLSYNHVTGLHKASYPDGAHTSYHHPSSHLEAVGLQTALIEAATSITLDTPLTHITGKCTIDDLLTYGNGLSGTGGANNNTITGSFTHTTGNLSSNGKVLHTHTHGGIQPGGGTTGIPT